MSALHELSGTELIPEASLASWSAVAVTPLSERCCTLVLSRSKSEAVVVVHVPPLRRLPFGDSVPSESGVARTCHRTPGRKRKSSRFVLPPDRMVTACILACEVWKSLTSATRLIINDLVLNKSATNPQQGRNIFSGCRKINPRARMPRAFPAANYTGLWPHPAALPVGRNGRSSFESSSGLSY